MSHFNVAVFTTENGKTVDELLAPYNENIEYAPYVKYTREQAIAKVRKDIENFKNSPLYQRYLADPEEYAKECHNEAHLEYLRTGFPQKLNWTDEECYQDECKWFEEDMIEPNGDLMSTYNPKSKWDWYSVGGRWNGLLVTKSGGHTDKDYASEIDFPDDFSTFAVLLPNRKWYERGKMGWWACVSNEDNDWDKNYHKFIEKAIEEDWMITIVDCHI